MRPSRLVCLLLQVVNYLFVFRICVVCVAPSHPLITDDSLQIDSVDFQNESFDLLQNRVYGKHKSVRICLTRANSGMIHLQKEGISSLLLPVSVKFVVKME